MGLKGLRPRNHKQIWQLPSCLMTEIGGSQCLVGFNVLDLRGWLNVIVFMALVMIYFSSSRLGNLIKLVWIKKLYSGTLLQKG